MRAVGLVVWFSLRVREVAGSIPARPHYFVSFYSVLMNKRKLQGFDFCTTTSRVLSSAVEHRIADPAVAGSIPAAPFFDPKNRFWSKQSKKIKSGGMLFSPCGPIGQGVWLRIRRLGVQVPPGIVFWGISSIGRVRALQARGTGIETLMLHFF